MTITKENLLNLYGLALNLYPSAFREVYQDEMRSVFRLRLEEVSKEGGSGIFRLALKELRDLPLALAAAYLRERNRQKMKRNLERWFVQEPGSGKEILLAVLPFFLTAFVSGLLTKIPGINQTPMWFGKSVLIALFLSQAVLGIIGLVVRLPRWSLPYAGLLIVLLSFGGLIFLDYLEVMPRPEGVSSYLKTILFLSAYLLVLFLLVMLGVWLASKIKYTQRFAEQVRNDKTLLPFMLYGGSLILVVVNYEDTAEGGFYLMLSALAMMAGAWIYLRQTSIREKMAALSLGNSAAILFALLANLYLLDFSSPPVFSIGGVEIKSIIIYVLFTWVVSQAMILVPFLFGGKAKNASGEQQVASL